ncbi:alkaline phosphatase [Psychrobacillus sp. NEAU-3TGS]|uniref:alkaline phosphatase n=1 Tax=Psychrobacillus sp. NEAU-3TGS TaxID=2995412 RepID=UPI002496B14E|nr:alkaline phosphatase [Psychrobacillus sp. NEAU-3TGS]MDI2589539.1 alkaline phosphatase [Psychrobacillus sp. NEAU-3TGS]
MFKKVGFIALSTGLVLSGVGLSNADAAKKEVNTSKVKMNENGPVENVIYMIPDGFGANHAANYRIFKGQEAVWDSHIKGMYTTYSANADITDSAAAGTAMAAGVKTNNGVIGFDPEGNKVKTILEASEEAGKSSGLVATSTITHATPASFASHVEHRSNETEIARQYIQESGVDVILGGGKNNFVPVSEGGKQTELDLIDEAQEKGFEFVETREQLGNAKSINVEKGDKLLGLFADGALAPEFDRAETEEPSLAEMTETAIDALNQDKDGFFLMVEGSQIDWAGEENDAGYAMHDTKAFEEAVQEAIEFAEQDGKTLVIVAGDHETGGMSVGSATSSDAAAAILKNVTATGGFMASQLNKDRLNVKEVILEYTGLELSVEEERTIQQAEDAKPAINKVLSERAGIGWTRYGHSAAPVPVFAFGPQSYKFVGFHDNTDLPKIISEAMKLK